MRTPEAGDVLESVPIVNDDERFASVMARAGECPEVVLEATYGWYWAVDALQAVGASVHLVVHAVPGHSATWLGGTPAFN